MVLGKWGLEDLLLLPLSADPAQGKRNFAKTRDAERAGHRVLAAINVDMRGVQLCEASGELPVHRALGLTSTLSKRALKGALSKAPDAVDALRAGHVAVLLAAGTVNRTLSRSSVAFTSAAVLLCQKRSTLVGGDSQELRLSTTSA